MAQRLILHLDDDPQITALVQRRLAAAQIRSVPLHDPGQLMDQLAQTGARLVLLDVDIPGTDGLELLRQIKQYDGTILVVMLTGLVGQTTVIRSLRYGAEACFFKPIENFHPLLECLEDAFRKIDRWWACLTDLVQRKRLQQSAG